MKKLFPIIMLLFSIVACDNYDNLRFSVSESILEFINEEYRGATIRETEYTDNGLFEVEIRHDSHTKDVYFDKNDNWVYSSWDVRVSSLPAAVKSAVEAAYPGYRIDDADFIERHEGSYYRLEIEKGGIEKSLKITKNGESL